MVTLIRSLYLTVVTASLFCFAAATYSQRRPPQFAGSTHLAIPKITTFPPLNSGMPVPVILGYIVGDSVAREGATGNYSYDRRSLSFSDTIREAIKYDYLMVDYDPVLFTSWGDTYRPGGPNEWLPKPSYWHQALYKNVRRIIPDTLKAWLPLIEASYILRVHVLSTWKTVDTLALAARTAVGVNAQVTEVLKGRNWMPCGEGKYQLSNLSDSCISFEYRQEWIRQRYDPPRNMFENTMLRQDSTDWVKPGEDYLVLLRYSRTFVDTDTTLGFTLWPLMNYSTMGSIYRIVDNNVQDTNQDFKNGAEISWTAFLAQFKGYLSEIMQ